MKQRVLAIAGAVILICAAILVGSRLGGDDGGGDGPSDDGDAPVVACTPDLASVCEQLADAGAIAADPPTLDLDEVADAPAGLDAWITWDPGPRVVAFATDDDGWGPSQPLAAAPLALASVPGGLDDACAGTPTWACTADAGRSGAALGVGSPATAEGLARTAPLVAALGIDDFDDLAAAVDDLVEGPTGDQDDATGMLTELVTAPGALDAVVAPAGLARDEAGTPQGQARQVAVADPTPSTAGTVVLATVPGGDAPDADDLCQEAADALGALGLEACRGTLMDDDLAGLLFQVHERLG